MSKFLRRLKRYGLIYRGFSDRAARLLIENKSTGQRYKRNLKLYGDYLFIYPVMGKYNKLADNLLTLKYIFIGDNRLPDVYFQVLRRNGVRETVALRDSAKYGDDIGVADLLRLKGSLLLMPSDLSCGKRDVLKYSEKEFFVNDSRVSEEELYDFACGAEDSSIVTENFAGIGEEGDEEAREFTYIVKNLDGYSPEIVGCYLKKSFGGAVSEPREDVCGYVKNIALSLKELELFGVEIIVRGNDFKAAGISSLPLVPGSLFDVAEFSAFITEKARQKRRSLRLKRRLFLLAKAVYSDIAEKRGYMGFMMKNWQRDLFEDWKFRGTTIREKLWSHKRGFFSYRIRQYGLTEENYKNFLPDRTYRKLRPINNGFVSWVYDKVITRYVLEGKKEYLPKYYYHLIRGGKDLRILALPDCKDGSKPDAGDIVKLLKKEGKLALKPSEGSHGEGFFKLEYRDGGIRVNDEEMEEEAFIDFLRTKKIPYNITEYLENNRALSEFYKDTTFTIRIMVINDKITSPQIANAYLRIATKKTGNTDNIGSGGVCARINLETGEIFEPEKIENHIITPCPVHPDTGAIIRGVIPNWREIKEGVKDVSRYICQLEYMGFDVVATEDSFKILEINTHQDLHRYHHYGSEVHRYFMEKVDERLSKRGRDNHDFQE